MSEATAAADTVQTPAADPAPTPAADAKPGAPGNLIADSAPKAEGDAPAADATPKADAPETVGAPEGDYAYTPPEGVEMDPTLYEPYAVAAREAGLTQRQFEALTPKAVEIIQAVQARSLAAWHETQRNWQAEVAADRELAGPTPGSLAPEASAAMHRWVQAYGGPELLKALSVTGAGNHPAMLKAIMRAGKAMGEEDDVSGAPRSPSGSDALANLYPSMT